MMLLALASAMMLVAPMVADSGALCFATSESRSGVLAIAPPELPEEEPEPLEEEPFWF